MKINSVLMTAFGAGSLALLSSSMNAANAAQTSFSMNQFTGSDATVNYTLEDIAGGGVKFTVDASSQLSDIRGVWFDISDDSLLSGLNILGNDITQTVIDANSVNNLGGGVNLNGGGTSAPFDVGVEIGTQGIGSDDIRSTTFNVFHDSVALSIQNFVGQDFGTRLTSVEVGANRNGSSKLVGMAPTGNNPPAVPEPLPGGMATTMSLLAIGGAFKVMSGKKRA